MRRVIKIGGSLLLSHSLAARLDHWIDHQQPGESIAIAGGGELIDAVRHLDQRFARGSIELHWECVRLLGVTHRWLGPQLDRWELCQTREEFARLRHRHRSTPANRVFVAVESFYHRETPSPLPEDWSTTTDAIAGWLSILIEADELVLLKSCDVDPDASLEQLARAGVIDGALPALADRLPPTRLVNLNAEPRAAEET